MFDFHDDMINMSDITERFEELRDARADLVTAIADAKEELDDVEEDADSAESEIEFARACKNLTDFDANDDDKEEREALEAIIDDLRGNGGDHQWESDWFPGYLIAESYFTEYAEDLCKDIGDIPKNIPSYIEIDWKKTAENLKVDYSEIEIDSTAYLYR